MRRFSDSERGRVTEAIHEAERKTSGEFVAVVAHAVDHDVFVALLWSAVLALFLPGFVFLMLPKFSGARWIEWQMGVFLVTAAVLVFTPGLAMRLIPKHIRHARARRFARAQFYEQGVHTTHDHSGVLFFVALAERYVEIVADKGIHERVGEAQWQKIIDSFLEPVRQGDIIGGLVAGIEACGRAMERHYPADPDAAHELSDGLIEI
ncbi:MAG: TPM domain-containing protein [Acidiferrobacteraceae bacterium]